jgi:hypothetical protein
MNRYFSKQTNQKTKPKSQEVHLKMLDITQHQGNQKQNEISYHLIKNGYYQKDQR